LAFYFASSFFFLLLAAELTALKDVADFTSLGEKRKTYISGYLKQLNGLLSTDSQKEMKIDAEDSQNLTELKSLKGQDFRSQLKTLIMDSDQEMIGLHAKATSSQGVIDAALRAWAKESMLLNHLKDSQALPVK